MRCFKLFVLFICLLNSYAYTAPSNQSKTKKVNNTNTKNQKAKRTIVRNTKQKKETIKQSKTKFNPSEVYQISKKTINLKSPMCQYAKKNDVVALKKALLASNYDESEVNTICENGESLLMIAVKNNNYLTSKFLIEKGADLNTQNDAGVTPLHIMARLDTNEIDRIFELFVSNKNLNMNLKDNEGYTPLMRAVDFEKISMIERLMNFKKVDVNIKNNYGDSALSLAKKNYEGKKTDEEKAISKHIIDILD